jgi:Bacteriophage baseplate protein W
MAKEFLGTGWTFPIGGGHDGKIALAEYDDSIRQSILIILNTSFGERIMRPDFGCGIHDFVFATLDTTSLARIERSVREALTLWEPRIEIEKVDLSTETVGDGKLNINIEYSVRTTNTRYNLVYPFYLTEAEQ